MKYWLSTLCLLLLSLTALAQDAVPNNTGSTPKVDLFAGYSYARMEGILEGDFDWSPNMNGWHASLARNLTSSLGVAADVSGHYGDGNYLHTVMVGPRFSYRRFNSVTPFAHAMAGIVNAQGVLKPRDTTFGFTLGGGVDRNLNNRFGLRLGQVDYLRYRYSFDQTNNLRVSTGIALRFGRK